MFQPIIIRLKSGDVGFCTLKYSSAESLKNQIEDISKSPDVECVELESHLPKLDLDTLRRSIAWSNVTTGDIE